MESYAHSEQLIYSRCIIMPLIIIKKPFMINALCYRITDLAKCLNVDRGLSLKLKSFRIDVISNYTVFRAFLRP